MKTYNILFAAILVALIFGPVSLDRSTMLWWAESQAAAGETVAKHDAGRNNSDAAHMQGRSVGSHLTPEEVRQLLTSHNKARAKVGLGPLVWSDRLAFYAHEWADHLASTSRRMEHRPHSGRWKQEHGENLFMGTAGYYGVGDAAAMWEREKSVYDGGTINESNVHACGHYTQIVWRTTKRIGCAKVECAGNVIVVCNYDPPGNVLGRTPY
jgi:pathogenesis-related protein 1